VSAPSRADQGRGPVVGRDAELAEIRRAASRLQRRQPQLPLELVGEAGIGKSTLLEVLRAHCMDFDAALLTGRASQFEQDLPFAPLLTALADHPEAAELGAATSSRAAHALVRELLERIGRDQRTLFLIDDLHWADPATKDLIGALLERPPRAAVLIAVAYRDHQVDGPLPAVISSAAARGTVRRIELGPLTEAAAQQLLDRSVTTEQADTLRQLCGGNPLLLSECARAARAGTWQIPRARAVGAPRGVAECLATELLPLSAAARSLLDAAAILGDPCNPDLAAAVGELDRTAADDALDELAGADLLRPAGDSGFLRFRHPLVREALHGATAPGWRRQAHARAAAVLTDAGATLPAVAHHIARSAEHGDLGAAELLTRAGREILPRSPASAADWLMTAWRLLPLSERGALENQQLLYALSVALSVRGRGDDALRVLAEAGATVEVGTPAARRLALGTAAIEATIGNHAASCRRLRAALLEAGDECTLETLQMYRSLAISLGNLGELAPARAAITSALQIGEQIGGLAPLASRPSAAWLAFLDGDDSTARGLFERSAQEFASVDDTLMPWLVDALSTHVRLAEYLERDDLTDLIARGLRATSDGLRPILAVDFLCARGRAELLHGTLRAARDEFAAAEEEAALLTDPASTFHAAIGTAQLHGELDDPEAALTASEAALVAARAYGPPYAIALAASLVIARQLDAGAPRRALSTARTWLAFPELPSATPDIRADICRTIARAHLALGDAELAADAAAAAAQHAERCPTPRNRRAALLAQAALAEHRGDAATAHALIRRAWDGARDQDDARSALALQLDVARATASVGDRATALELVESAELQLLTLASPRLDRLAASTWRALGRRRRGALDSTDAAPDPSVLTPQQRAVVERAVAGRTNSQIAAELCLSVKTVESHLTASYAKLGINSRRDLPSVATRVFE
jgi:ATP/maltotriose-dependent transcriptional regulator MalT